jgi:RNA polymerase sigma-70 factor (ECF subfamily)
MLKITQQDAPDATTLWLEGRLTAPWIDELERVCAALAGRRLQLDLSGLVFVDEAAAAALVRLLGGPVTCIGASPLVRELLGNDPADELLARLRAGDAAAFEAVVRAHGGRMLATARRLLCDDVSAGRAVQAAFAAAFDALTLCASADELGRDLLRRTVRAALDELRARDSRATITALLPRFGRDGARVGDEADELFRNGFELERSAPALQARVRACVEELPEPFRAVLLLADVEGFAVTDAAVLLDLDVAEMRSRLHRARQALRVLLARALRSTNPAHEPLSA